MAKSRYSSDSASMVSSGSSCTSYYDESDQTDYDRGTIKQLSTSTPAMTAQAQPPSPKATSKDEKPPTTSKARQKKFHRHFPAATDEQVLNYYSCALIGDILLQGHLYITTNYFAFYSNVFGYVTKLLIPLLSVEKITKEKTARIIPNAVGIATSEDKHVFGSLMSRDNTYRFMNKVWDAARNNAMPINSQLDLTPVVPSEDSDSSESENEPIIEDSTVDHAGTIKKIPQVTPAQVLTTGINKHNNAKPNVGAVFKRSYSEFRSLPTQTLLLYASTILLLVLFLSAAVLLYRIGKVHNKYNLSLQDNLLSSDNADLYSELLQWQAQLHSKSAGAVHNFLDANLDQIAKVRQSLEALSTLLMAPVNNNNSANRNAQSETSENHQDNS